MRWRSILVDKVIGWISQLNGRIHDFFVIGRGFFSFFFSRFRDLGCLVGTNAKSKSTRITL